ncbi:hypothetical protein AB0E59_17535 [Lentzea sp. NPDC034063]|uniref:ArsR/SmtB family transcription factor n=1 Tax=unclassified Lentzea TaxID=2643253 RepID=UPI0033EC0C14
MDVEWFSSVVERTRLHAVLGEPARLAIVDRLLLGDASPSEVGRELGLPSDLLAHHLKLLERIRSDQRRNCLRLRAELREGERVLDLGSGGGIDVLLSARRVDPTGKPTTST